MSPEPECRSDRDGTRRVATVAGLPMRYKAIVPWRFQRGFVRRPVNLSDGVLSGGDGRSSEPNRAAKANCNLQGFQCNGAREKKKKKIQIRAAASSSVQQKKIMYEDVDRHQVMPKKTADTITRETLMASLQELRVIHRKLLEENSTADSALQIFRETLDVDRRRYVGTVPGVEVGDVFDSDFELCFVGIHRSRQSCVDYITNNGGRTCLAVSIISSYPQRDDGDVDFLLHVDQEIQELALKQSMDNGTPVRVISRFAANHQAGSEVPTYYVYGGLYLVKKFCREEVRKDQHKGTFQLRRMSRQTHIDIGELVRKRMALPSNGTFIADISAGLEKIPVSAINSISNEYPMPFCYISRIQRLPNCHLDPPSGCDCIGRCSDLQECACAVKNGGVIPFNDDGDIIDEKPLVYECGPSCKCPPTCHNRVSQHGIKFRLQIFKTKSMGWGVRSLDFIPRGSFVCEYVGELLDNENAQERENDEYLFIIGDNYYKVPRWEVILETIPSLRNRPGEHEVNVFALDALKRGNLARFINHSCTPNRFPQNVLYDHDDTSMPHIVLFAGDDIPPLQPLSYDYNYTIDGVHDSDGNIKKKQCFCCSSECNGWLY